MRGKVFVHTEFTIEGRITPAYAGKSLQEFCAAVDIKDHPRLCGEKCKWIETLPYSEGSPPPMRGKARDAVHSPRRTRITPAYAGKRANWFRFFRRSRDHPRLCGEKNSFPFADALPAGITPAYAGKSFRRRLEYYS